ncbi:MAG: radical SAM protein [Candidatus Nitrosotenuis sp.]
MSKEVVLIQPKAGTFDMIGARLPIGLLSIAAIPYQMGYKIKIIDQRVDKAWRQTLSEALKKEPICVGITSMTGKQILYGIEAAKIVREKSKVPIVWGGVHVTLMPEQSIENPYVDIIVIGEGDYTFAELVEAIAKGESLKTIKGIYYKENGRIIKNPERPFIKNLDELPELPYELVNIDAYSSLKIEGRSLDFVTSRGCSFRCSFCYNNYFNKSMWRSFSAKETVRRLKNFVRRYNVRTVYFQDDNFFNNLKRIREILIGIINEGLKIKWGTLGLRIDTAARIDDELFQLMVDSGCINVDIGVESGSRRILDMIDKRITIEDVFKVNKRIAKYPFIIKYTFIIGFPTETKEERVSTIKTALALTKENKHAYTPIFVYTPYPGTPMYEFALKNGFEPPKNLEEWGNFGYNTWYYSFKSWLNNKQVRELKSIEFTSYFSNRNIKYKINRTIASLLFELYHPIAKFRFKNYFHAFPFDSMLFKKMFESKL